MPAKRQPGHAASTIAKLLRMTVRRLTQLANEGIAIRVAHGRYDLTKTVQNYIRYLKAQTPERGSKRDEDQTALLSTRREMAEIELGERRGDLFAREAVESVVVETLVLMTQRLEGLGGRLAMDLAGESNPAKIRRLISDEVSATRQGIADGLGRLCRDVEKLASDRKPAKKANARRVGRRGARVTKGKRRTRAVQK